jgi:hypothetical protein
VAVVCDRLSQVRREGPAKRAHARCVSARGAHRAKVALRLPELQVVWLEAPHASRISVTGGSEDPPYFTE